MLAIKDTQAGTLPQLQAITSVMMPSSAIFANTVNFNGKSAAGQVFQSTEPLKLDDYFVPANFCPIRSYDNTILYDPVLQAQLSGEIVQGK